MLNFIFKELNRDWHKRAFMVGLYLSYFLYFCALTGIIMGAPQYLTILHTVLIYYISFFLILKFNPFTRQYYQKNDHKFERKIAYYSGVFLLLTTSFTTFFQNEFKNQLYKLNLY